MEGDWQTNHRFFAENRRLLAEAEELEHRARRRGLVVGEDELFAFYDARIPADVVSAQHFDTWWKQARRADPGLLTFKAGDLLSEDAAQVERGFLSGHLDLAVPRSRRCPCPTPSSPGSDADGVTVDIPLSRLNQVNPAEFSWQVPGLRAELVTEMIRSLPKALRRDLVPAPDVAREVVARLGEPAGDLRDAVARELRRCAASPCPGRLGPVPAAAAPADHGPGDRGTGSWPRARTSPSCSASCGRGCGRCCPGRRRASPARA